MILLERVDFEVGKLGSESVLDRSRGCMLGLVEQGM